MERVIATGYPRLHFSLVDMAGASNRMYGGFGISIKAFPITVEAILGNDLTIETSGFIEECTKQKVLQAITNAQNRTLNTNCKLKIHSESKQHIGLGSSTQIILTVLDAMSTLNHWNVSSLDIIDISGRGRTSMIGFSTHYYGGFCIDAGQKYNPSAIYLPSHSPRERCPSLFIGNWDFPSNWFISLIGVESPIAMDATKEDEFMRSNTPMEIQSGLEAIADLYHGILPAIVSQDYLSFAISLQHIQSVGWKAIELGLQSSSTLNALNQLWKQNFVAGLSSFGPIVAVVHSIEYSDIVRNIAMDNGLSFSGPYSTIPKFYSMRPINPFIDTM